MRKILVTAALPYINNIPHLGHMVGCHLPADIFARYCRQRGYDITFVGGSDEHGTPSVIAANKKGVTVQEFVDDLHERHKRIYEKFNISYDLYSRTSSSDHKKNTHRFFAEIDESFLVEKEEELYYSEEDKMFLPDRFLVGICPACGGNANSDQCEACGKLLSAKELLEPKSILSGTAPVLKKSKHLYLDLSKLSDSLEEWLDSKKDTFKKHVYAEAKKWIKEGLRERSITRDMKWGVEVNREGFEDKVFYVWFDAPIGYDTFARLLSVDWEERDTYHFLGKDNVPFHTIFWPGMLLAAGRKLPHNVVGFNYLTYEGEKFSKSKNVGVFCESLIDIEGFDIDTMRFYLAYSIPEVKDADFKWSEYMQVTNSLLIGNVANFFNRTLSMSNKYFNGQISINNVEQDEILSEAKNRIFDEVAALLEQGEIRKSLKAILDFSSLGNEFLERSEPWKASEEQKMNILYLALDHISSLVKLLRPFIPSKVEEFVLEQLNMPNFDFSWAPSVFIKDHKINTQKPLFKRLDEEEIERIKKEAL